MEKVKLPVNQLEIQCVPVVSYQLLDCTGFELLLNYKNSAPQKRLKFPARPTRVMIQFGC